MKDQVKIEKLTLNIDGTKVSVTPEQAKKLHAALDELFGEKKVHYDWWYRFGTQPNWQDWRPLNPTQPYWTVTAGSTVASAEIV